MIAGIPVPSLIVSLLMGLANGDLHDRWDKWLNRQIKDPDVCTTSYFQYNRIDATDVYEELYERLYLHFAKQAQVQFTRCAVIDAKLLYLEDDGLHVRYFVKYRYT